MQNKYVGDIGDFGKYGLLRALSGDPLRLGVVWYLFPDEGNNDGKFTDYLRNPSARDKKLRDCDPELYDELYRIVIEKKNRRVEKVQQSGVLPGDAVFYGQSLYYQPRESGGSRILRRIAWLNGALESTVEADVVFVDPDNGITENSIQFRKNGPKYVFMDDLSQFYGRGQSLIIYHHLARWDNAYNQIAYFADRLKECLKLPYLPPSLWYHRGTARAYFIVPHERHKAVLEKRLESFLDSPWCKQGHFERVT